ncbi:Flp pilus assembly protein CpaB [Salibacterium aidingense]|uniref:Flp pilus assembly protein CpaB n=1 Tax=Salibacterium aidingense TaxID=384933 RepID=UPI0004057B65|nr:RcpC/CpaB family pilus assembly protein [Salibacterium aidingense]
MSKKNSVVKRKKKPTVLIPLVIAGLVAFLFYTGSAKKAEEVVSPVEIPMAAETLSEHEKISKEDIQIKEVPSSSVPPNAVTNPEQIVNKIVNTKTSITKNSMFMNGEFVEMEEIPSNIGMRLNGSDLGLTMRVDLEKSVANSLNDGMDVQVRFFTDNTPSGKAFEGVLEERIKVIAVRDSRGDDVNRRVYTSDEEEEDEENSDSNTVPTIIVFEATSEQASYLLRAQQLGELNILAVSDKSEDQEQQVTAEGKEEIDSITTAKEEGNQDTKETEEATMNENKGEGENDSQDSGESDTAPAGQSFDGNRVKLFIESMSYKIDDQIKEQGSFITTDGEVVVYDEETEELRYFESEERYEGSKYMLQELTDEEMETYIDEMEEENNQ